MSDDAPSPVSDFARELYSSDGWKYRRALLFAVIAILSGLLTFGVVRNTGAPTEQTAVWGTLGAIVTLTGSYVFGAIWDDQNKRRFLPPPPFGSRPGDGPGPDCEK